MQRIVLKKPSGKLLMRKDREGSPSPSLLPGGRGPRRMAVNAAQDKIVNLPKAL